MPGSDNIRTINAAMPMDYGTSPNGGGQREQLDGYFDDSAPEVVTKKYRFDPLRCFPCTRRKKICCVILSIVVILFIIILAVAISAAVSKDVRQALGLEGSGLRDGSGCAGNKESQRQCASGECIAVDFVCDGFADCPDAEDEDAGACQKEKERKACKDNEYPCLGIDQNLAQAKFTCIPIEARCDGLNDCSDWSDEENCFVIATDSSVMGIYKGKPYPLVVDIDSTATKSKRQVDPSDPLGEDPFQQDDKTDNNAAEERILGQLICEQSGFGGLRDIYTAEDTNTGGQCVIARWRSEDEKIEDTETPADLPPPPFVVKQVECAGKRQIAIECESTNCGIFGDYNGPSKGDSWTNPLKTEAETTDIPFPWVVDIKSSTGEVKCSGSIVSEDFVVTYANCISDDIFFKQDANWTVVAASFTDKPQTRTITKVITNHFNKLDGQTDDDLAVLQMSSAFLLNGYVHAACLKELEDRLYCFVSGKEDGEDEPSHIRIKATYNDEECGIGKAKHVVFDDQMCYTVPRTAKSDKCVRTKGSPISCLHPVFTNWVMAGVMMQDIGCAGSPDEATKQPAIDTTAEYNFNWLKAVTDDDRFEKSECGQQTQVQSVRYMKGSRAGEYYIEVKGWGRNDQWHTVYELQARSPEYRIIINDLEDLPNGASDNRLSNNSQIITKKAAILHCPEGAKKLCGCDIAFTTYKAAYKSASSIITAVPDRDPTDDEEDENNPFNKDYDYWDNSNSDVNDPQTSGDYDPPTDNEVEDARRNLLQKGNCTQIPGLLQCLFSQQQANPYCISEKVVCDGVPDCPDASDENLYLCPTINRNPCPTGSFVCRYSYKCIARENRCNGNIDCDDTSDESGCFALVDSYVVANSQGNEQILSSANLTTQSARQKGVTDIVADDICYAMGYLGAQPGSAKEVNITAADKTSSSGTCWFIPHPEQSNTDILPMLLAETEKCDQLLQLTCNKCGFVSEKFDAKNTALPWSGFLQKDKTRQCEIVLVNHEWVLLAEDCVKSFDGDLEVVTGGVTRKATLFVKFYRTQIVQGETAYNTALIRVHPQLEKKTTTKALDEIEPVCIEEDSLIQYPGCYIIANVTIGDAAKDTSTESLRLMLADSTDECVQLSEDKECMRLSYPAGEDFCASTKDRGVYCYDSLTKRSVLAGLASHDVGKKCGDTKGHNNTIAVTTIDEETEWINNVAGLNEGSDVPCGRLGYSRAGVVSSWYAVLTNTDKAGADKALLYTLHWGTNDTITLQVISENIRNEANSAGVSEIKESSNITSLHSLKVSCTDVTKGLCDCEFEKFSGVDKAVPIFYLVLPTSDEAYVDPEAPPAEKPNMQAGEEGNK